jgi:hypothetical protein
MSGPGTEQRPASVAPVEAASDARHNPLLDRLPPRTARTVQQLHLLSLVVAALLLIYDFTRRSFKFDEWDFLANRGVRLFGPDGLLYPHNQHWSTIPILVWRAIFDLVGVHDYWLYALPLVAAHLLCAHLLWRIMLRHDVDPWVATILAATFVVVGIGGGDLTWAFQFGFVGSLAFGLLAVEAIEHDGRILPALWGTCALMCSGLGVPMVIGTGLVALARRRYVLALLATAIPGVIFAIWWLKFGSGLGTTLVVYGVTVVLRPSLTALVKFTWSGLTFSFAGYVDLPSVVGAVLAVVLGVAVLWRRNVPAALAVTSIAVYGFIGLGRLSPDESRYSYFTIALVLPLLGQLVTALIRVAKIRQVVLVGLVVLVPLNLVLLQRRAAATAQPNPEQSAIGAAAYLIHNGEKFSGSAATNYLTGMSLQENLTVATLTTMIARGQFSVPARVPPDALAAERQVLQVFASPQRAYPGSTALLASRPSACKRINQSTSVTLDLSGPSSFRVEAPFVPPAIPQGLATASVELESTSPAQTLGTAAYIRPDDRWLNLPAGNYRTVVLSSVLGGFTVCPGTQ